MNKIPKYEAGLQYSEDVMNSVRYGYLYRKDAEKNLSVHACIGDVPDILLWLANAIIGGFVWDVIKSAVNKINRSFKKDDTHLDEETMTVLKDETNLYNFIIYIKEFNERRMSVDDEQLKYVKKEIEADYVGKELSKIMGQEKREATIQEIMKVYQEAKKKSDHLAPDNYNS